MCRDKAVVLFFCFSTRQHQQGGKNLGKNKYIQVKEKNYDLFLSDLKNDMVSELKRKSVGVATYPSYAFINK